jgi:enterochelin esterase-like enzyme
LASGHGTSQASFYSTTLGERIHYLVRMPRPADTGRPLRTLYLLHGRGHTMTVWRPVLEALDQLIGSGAIAPLIAVAPDAPWSARASWYVDSLFAGASTPGRPVETALTRDLVAHVDATYPTMPSRQGRIIGGYSMGGAGALRYALAHQDVFGAALVLSPAVYIPLPPMTSTVRRFGAFGVGSELFDAGRYQALGYPELLPTFDPALPLDMFLATGDNEYVHPDPDDALHDMTVEAAFLHNRLVRTPGVTVDWRVLGGTHDWGVWRSAFDTGLRHLHSS